MTLIHATLLTERKMNNGWIFGNYAEIAETMMWIFRRSGID